MCWSPATLRSVTLRPVDGVSCLEAELYDGSAAVTLIWLGGVLIALGGLFALVGRWWRGYRTRRRLVEAAW